MRNNDDGETDDDLVEGSLEDGKSDSCNNCGRYLDNMTEMEERFDARTHELEETPEEVRQAISELSRELSTNEIALFSIVLSAEFGQKNLHSTENKSCKISSVVVLLLKIW